MATMTAQVLIGRSHPNDGGIIPEWMLQVSENSRPYFLLHNNVNMTGKPVPIRKFRRYGWVPNLNHSIEDMLGMIALHIIEHPPLVSAINDHYPAMLRNHVEAYDTPAQILELLYKGIEDVKEWPILIISSYQNCHFSDAFSKLENYPIYYEICRTVDHRVYSQWENT